MAVAYAISFRARKKTDIAIVLNVKAAAWQGTVKGSDDKAIIQPLLIHGIWENERPI
jgi:hypothetical protein